ncbi:uncharacterized protein [Temnothorax longispinosus]|uniref:Vitellogenin domain-containing protein n=1 Tax=Temnothorax longispinosus TaxID=300112 RepID=A0A4V3S7J2_9HYME|nr:hypothetical protein DBV15_09166 [Temnothorax longispinosus]
MLLNYTLVPFLLALKVNVPEGIRDFNAEYLFDFDRTTVVYKEYPETTQITAALICQPFQLSGLRCFLHDVMTLKTVLKYKNRDTEEIAREHIKYEKWFIINFNEHGVQDVLVHTKSEGTIRKIIADIAKHFNISGGLITKILNFTTGLTVRETTPLGNCRIKYNMTVLYGNYERNEKQDLKFQIIPFAMAKQFAELRDAHIRIEKNRLKCKLPSARVSVLANRIEMDKYNYKMEIANDKLNISSATRMLDDLCELDVCFIMTETVLLNLTNIRSPQTVAQNEFYKWTAFNI